jgi:hypothetical protein
VKSTKLFLNELGNQVEYSYTRKESRLKRFCTVHATESYALVIVIKYEIQDSGEQEIIASNLDYPGIEYMKRLIYWVKKLKPFVEPISSESESESDSESGIESEIESGNDS